MTTQYTSILKLALPVQGELSGTWGDVVNDNITSMVEQAIAGRAVIDSWTANAHTLTTANGVTSESRCAMLEFTDSGTQLTGAGSVVCPTLSKIYIAKNASGQNVTLKTSGGTGILVPNGRTMFLFCDGTNVVEAVTSTTSLQLGTSTTVTAVLDEDDMASNSAVSLATQQSIKAYVDAQVATSDTLAEVLANGNTTGGTDVSVSTDDKVQFRDAAIYINSSADGQLDIVADTEIQIAAPIVDVNGILDVSGNIVAGGTVDGRDVATDGTKLDGIEASADVTDTTNVTAAGALMDSEVTNLAQVKAFDSSDYATAAQGTKADAALPTTGGAMTGAITTNSTFDGRDVATDGTKLDGIEASADVTDTINVTAAGALMDSEVTNLAQVKAFDSADYATAAQGAKADAALPTTGGAMTGAITTNSTFDGRDVATDGTKLDGIEAGADVTDTANVTAAGAVMDSELTSEAAVKALNQGVATTDSPSFAGLAIAKNDQTNGATLSITNSFNGGGWDAGDTIGSINFRTDDSSTTQPVRGQVKVFEDTASGATYPNSNAMSFSTGLNNDLSERMRIDSSGKVGIGTTTPSQALTVNGTDARIYLTGANTDIDMDNSVSGQLSLDGNAYGFGIALNADGAQLYTNSVTRDLIFGVNETEVARITPSGLDVIGDITATGNITLNGANSVQVPSGTTAQRSGSPVNGMFRYNSTTAEFEGYQNGAWGSIGGAAQSVVTTAPTSASGFANGHIWYVVS